MRITLSVVGVVLALAWWKVLNVIEHNHWPPPDDAVTPEQAQAVTEAFARRDDPLRDDAAIAYAPSTASDVRLFIDGTQFFPAMLDDINAARTSVHIMIFTFAPDEWGTRFADALIAKAQSGVEVRLSVDRYGAKVYDTSEALFDRMSAAGVQVVVNDVFPFQATGLMPDRDWTWRQDEIGQVDHRKMLVIDGITGWVGGGGFEDHFANGEFHDVFVRVQGNVVRQMQAIFLTSFRAYGGPVSGEPGSLAAYFPAPADPGTIRATLLQNIPGGFLPGTQASRATIEQATGTLDIMNPYLTDPGIIDRIVDAGKRGVKVRVLVSAKSNNAQGDAALRHEYGRLQDAGVEIWEFPAIMHAKVTVADDTAIIGTINYDAWALYRNLEIALMFEDATVADDVRATYIEPDVARSQPGQAPDDLDVRVKNWIWNKLAYFL
ncbi:MAG TPA: phosphatidylserine/phosphatidylglycerophosphate/cardiolipin synthase family protein [Thermomicrobiales bacterium]|nr:phosphatidylserine/phosphatidylglycerophosphate/cardiolipin synthase family protein [Thermomicrobiales bacterium]